MAIVTLQRRLREIGRIRIGEQVETGNGKTRPAKLDTFRLTSRDEQVITAAAEQFGGIPAPWTAPDGQQWEVKTTTSQLQVIVPPSDMSFSQFYEQWSAGGCQARCDGEWDYVNEKACHCDPEDRACAIHSRLSVMLPDLPGLGVWRLDTSGYYAATELAGIVEVCQSFSARGQMLPARLRLEQRTVKRIIKGAAQTRRFPVPVLDLDVHPLVLVQASTPAAALEAPAPSFGPVPPELPSAPVPTIAEQAAAVGEPAPRQRRANAAEPLKSTGMKPRTAAEAQGGPVCVRCGTSLAGFAAEPGDGGLVHKGGCPSAGEPAEAGESDSEGAPPADAQPTLTDADLGRLATKVFGPVGDQVPRGEKTKTIDRLRHGLTLAVTGRTTSLKDVTPEERNRLHHELTLLETGFNSWEYEQGESGDWLEIRPSAGGQGVRIDLALTGEARGDGS